MYKPKFDYGFNTVRTTEACTEFKKEFNFSNYELRTPEELKRETVAQFAEAIIKSDLLTISTMQNPMSNSIQVTLSMNVSKSGTKFVVIEEDEFINKGVSFTEKELALAVEQTFPERFI